MPWTSEQVMALAPDAASASAGRGLASPQKWSVLSSDDRAVWGECQGSGARPYQVQIDLSEPAFRCTCPSRKFPCKHGIALFLLFTTQKVRFQALARPEWVADWLAKRDARAEAKSEVQKPELSQEEQERSDKKSAQAAAKRASDRESRVDAGIEELDLWLKDMIRQGVAVLQGQTYRFWEARAARLVDAQAPGLAGRVRDLAGISTSGEGWAERMLIALARLHLLVQAYRRIEQLPQGLQATVRSHIGWTIKQDELENLSGVTADWVVVGRRVIEEEKIVTQRIWLRSDGTARNALILNFAVIGQNLDTSLIPGTKLTAEIVYYPSALPMRAAIRQRSPDVQQVAEPFEPDSGTLWQSDYAAALSQDPWMERFPVALSLVCPYKTAGGWVLVSHESRAIPLHAGFEHGWPLMAISGGRPISVFGEWDGAHFLPLSAVADGRFVSFA